MDSATERPTHAGGVVHRVRDGRVELLLVTAKRRPDEWVLPKGHLEPGETPERAATREVAEEAGVVAAVERALGTMTIERRRERQVVSVWLMRAEGETPAEDARRVAWLAPADAEARATHPETKRLVAAARAALAGGAAGGAG